jgi:hypothetical protein
MRDYETLAEFTADMQEVINGLMDADQPLVRMRRSHIVALLRYAKRFVESSIIQSEPQSAIEREQKMDDNWIERYKTGSVLASEPDYEVPIQLAAYTNNGFRIGTHTVMIRIFRKSGDGRVWYEGDWCHSECETPYQALKIAVDLILS